MLSRIKNSQVTGNWLPKAPTSISVNIDRELRSERVAGPGGTEKHWLNAIGRTTITMGCTDRFRKMAVTMRPSRKREVISGT